MKIIQVATLISPSGEYGGPVRVAVNQTRELLAAGHDVLLAAGAQGFGRRLPSEFDGVPVMLFEAFNPVPKTGFSGLVAPALQKWLKTAVKSADVAHIHLSRDLVTLPAATEVRRRKLPYVLQTHGMITPSNHPLAGTVDAVWTKRALEGADTIFYLTPQERLGLSNVTRAPLNLKELHNGVPETRGTLATAEAAIEVLFLARLHSRKRPLMFVAMAKALHSKYPDVRFSIVGPDGGEGPAIEIAIRKSGMGDALRWEGALSPEDTTSRINRSTIYVLPSVDEPFPMSVLEALSLGKPVVVTDSCGLAAAITEASAGTVIDSSLESLVVSIDRLLANPDYRKSVGVRARVLAEQKFSMKAVCDQLQLAYSISSGAS
ncbi:glycosyltransferase [Arthrobacter sp. PsM3]|uniref:glycosyltransferase n=1 Tax=Arthrobacter sp. PsM3 TaxID=3030531 RepID=UPI00263BBAE3|nr:glycosyltransferase [Arthrobacter sp. PsM3]MDN4645142.1 glycosyltransferase [Arthrobacter sp. PsM3]